MTVKELKNKLKNDFADIEIYRNFNSKKLGFHTDRIKAVEDYSENDEILEWELMNKDDYQNTILANVSISWEDLGFPESDKILVVKIK